MKITDLVPTKRNSKRVSVFVDGDFAVALSDEAAHTHRLCIGMEVDGEELEAWASEDEGRKAVDKACYLLGYRNRSCGEIRQKLREKGFSKEAMDFAVETLLERGYLDDLKFSREYVQSLLERGYGEQAIRAKLYEKRVERDVIDQALTALEDEDMLGKAVLAGEKILARQAGEADETKIRRRFYDGLYRRGYSYDLAKQAYAILTEGES